MARTRSRTRRATVAGALLVPLLLTGTAAAGSTAAVDGAPVDGAPGIGDPYFPTYGNGGYDVAHYDLAVRYDPGTDRLEGQARIDATATEALRGFHLDLVGLTVRRVLVDGAPASWTRSGGHELVVTPARPLAAGAAFSVQVTYDGVPQPFTDPTLGTYGFLKTDDGAIAVGEPEVAAQWFPVNDHPADKATYRIAITAPRGLETVSNGLVASRTVDGDWATTTWAPRDPMASYLAFVAIGQFDLHRWRTGTGLPVVDAIDSKIQGSLRRRIESSFARQGEILAAEARWFGPYPLETAGGVVDRVDVGFALENQTRPTYSSAFWDVPDQPTLGDDVVVHELAHQWYGDAVALRRWRDVWLNEGFATYAEWLWQEREHGFTPQEQFDALYAQPASSPLWQLEIGNPGPDQLFASPVYVRGAMTLQALRATVGTDTFFDILRTWASNHRDGNGTTDAFVALAERKAGRPLGALFDQWLHTSGKPTRPAAPTATPQRQAEVDGAVAAWRSGLEARVARGQQ